MFLIFLEKDNNMLYRYLLIDFELFKNKVHVELSKITVLIIAVIQIYSLEKEENICVSLKISVCFRLTTYCNNIPLRLGSNFINSLVEEMLVRGC